ncbi:hypothetical protein KR009_004253, partial [Drosophila setifemur]
SMFTNNINQYELISTFKNGRFGTVYKGSDLNTKKFIVVKKIALDQRKDEKFTMLCKELFNIRQFKHQNINTIVHCFINMEYAYLIYPFMCFGDCQMLLQNVYTAGFPETLTALILKDVISALIYIHSNHFVHGSIKSQHILINSKKAVISNFSDCRSFINQGKIESLLYGSTEGMEKQLKWIAPEVLYQNLCGYDEKIDIYSTGITCCEMANGFQPFKDTELTLMFTEKLRGNLSLCLDECSYNQGSSLSFHHRYKSTENLKQKALSDNFYQFVEICLNKNPMHRWSASKLLMHSFLKQCRNTSISKELNDLYYDLPTVKNNE